MNREYYKTIQKIHIIKEKVIKWKGTKEMRKENPKTKSKTNKNVGVDALIDPIKTYIQTILINKQKIKM